MKTILPLPGMSIFVDSYCTGWAQFFLNPELKSSALYPCDLHFPESRWDLMRCLAAFKEADTAGRRRLRPEAFRSPPLLDHVSGRNRVASGRIGPTD